MAGLGNQDVGKQRILGKTKAMVGDSAGRDVSGKKGGRG